MSSFVLRLDKAVDNEDYIKRWKYRVAKWETICKKQFQLVYFGKMDYDSVENMSVHEREFFYSELVNQKTQEREQYEKAVQEAKQGSKGR